MSQASLLGDFGLKEGGEFDLDGQHDNHLKSHQTLGSLRSFFSVLWLLFLESLILISFIILILRPVEDESTENGLEDESEGTIPAPSFFTCRGLLCNPHFYYITPSCIMLLSCILVFFSTRGSRLANLYMIFSVIIAVVLQCTGIFLSGYVLINDLATTSCVERKLEKWNPFSSNVTIFAVNVWSMPFRIAAARCSFMLSRAPVTVHNNYYKEEPHMEKLEKALDVMNWLITRSCMPHRARGYLKLNPQHQNTVHHLVQLMYEIILLAFAMVEDKQVEILSICLGLLGAAMGLVKLHKLDIVFNTGATLVSVIALGVECANLACKEASALNFTITLVIYSINANAIRVKSMLHAHVLSKEKLWQWLKEQKGWIYVSKPSMLLLSPMHTHNHHHTICYQLKQHSDELRYGDHKALMLFVLLLGLSMTVSAALLVEFYGLDNYLELIHAREVQSYTQQECKLLDWFSQHLPDEGNLARVVFQIASDKDPVAGVTLAGYLKLEQPEVKVLEQYSVPSTEPYECWIPTTTVSYATMQNSTDDQYDGQLIVVTTKSELSFAIRTYYGWIIGPPVCIFLLIAAIVVTKRVSNKLENKMHRYKPPTEDT